ncbi:MAG: GntR family transcriptional regulator [Nitratireductor sp.]
MQPSGQHDKQDVASSLRQQILSLQISPGQMLDEAELAQAFGISRTPLREVIQRLGGEGYLVFRKNRGAKVAPMDLTTLRQFFQAAPMIYAAVARLAAENATASGIRSLKEIQKTYRAAIAAGDGNSSALENHRFHAEIGVMAASAYLLPSLNRLLIDHTRIGQIFYRSNNSRDSDRIRKAADQHDELIAAIGSHSPAEAVEITLRHWALSRDQMERFVQPDPLPFEIAGGF